MFSLLGVSFWMEYRFYTSILRMKFKRNCFGAFLKMPEDRFPKQLFSQEWNRVRGRQRSRVIDDLFVSLGLDDIEGEVSSLASYWLV